MQNRLLHTPDGVRDIYNDECEQKLLLEKKLTDVQKAYGYHPIQTPTFEFFDIFSKEIGTTPSKDLYKFFDKEGNTLVLRPDITPSIARCASKYYMYSQMPLRFCYTGSAFKNNISLHGYLKERTQLGAELIGDASVDGDAELIALSIRLLLEAGLKDFQVSVGHVDYLKGLFEASNLDEDTQNTIKEYLLNRNFYAVEDIITSLGIDDNLVTLYKLMNDVMLTKEKIMKAKLIAVDYPKVYKALERLEEVENVLEVYGLSKYVFYELTMISRYEYYTGIIFAAYTYGTGAAIVTGGRYDNLLSNFGKDSAAIGFVILIDTLMMALKSQNIEIKLERNLDWIVYKPEMRNVAIRMAEDMRLKGKRVELMPINETMSENDYRVNAVDAHVNDVIVL